MLELLASTLRLSTPLIFASQGGLFCERSGIATICLEGVMLMSAWTAAAVNFSFHNPWLAVFSGMLAGMLTMLLHAFLCITARANQIISGVAINILAAGLTPVLNMTFFLNPTSSPTIPREERIQAIGIFPLDRIPEWGNLIFTLSPLILTALLLPFGVQYLMYRTGWGLRIIASGDGPEALRTCGVKPERVRYLALLIGGSLASLGGIYLSISHGSGFVRDMTAGRGYIALAALIFGKWRPLPTLAACILFGFADAFQIQLQSAILFGWPVPVQAIQALPYVITLLVLVGFMGKARPPIAIGQ